jgi:hypothetical protein
MEGSSLSPRARLRINLMSDGKSVISPSGALNPLNSSRVGPLVENEIGHKVEGQAGQIRDSY